MDGINMTNLRAYAQLVRLPNVFTALADIGLAALATGALVDHGSLDTWRTFVFLLMASACLYCGGMVWNDIFDLEQDRRERPFRPLPSGNVRRPAAIRLGVGLLAGGLAFSGLAAWNGEMLRGTPLLLGGVLVTAILLYDGWLKRTWGGPLGMGACRFLNVLFGLTIVPEGAGLWGVYLALTVGVYIVGVTWFARTEARLSNRELLMVAAAVMLAGLLMTIPLPVLAADRPDSATISSVYLYFLVVYGLILGIPVSRAIRQPSPAHVQRAVKRAVLGLVAFDAILATALVGLLGLVLLVLLPPALYLGRWLYST
jgi:4-hydroxybenzoate polyprenyltransferase